MPTTAGHFQQLPLNFQSYSMVMMLSLPSSPHLMKERFPAKTLDSLRHLARNWTELLPMVRNCSMVRKKRDGSHLPDVHLRNCPLNEANVSHTTRAGPGPHMSEAREDVLDVPVADGQKSE